MERLEQLDDLVPLSLPHVVDADHAHLDVVVEQKVEQTQKRFERVVVRPAWERAVGRDVTPNALDGLSDGEEFNPTADTEPCRFIWSVPGRWLFAHSIRAGSTGGCCLFRDCGKSGSDINECSNVCNGYCVLQTWTVLCSSLLSAARRSLNLHAQWKANYLPGERANFPGRATQGG